MNYIDIFKKQAQDIIINALKSSENELNTQDTIEVLIEAPKDTTNGDFATSFALKNAKTFGKKPQDIANILIKNANLENTYFKNITVAGPGFINFTLNSNAFVDVLKCVSTMGENFGQNDYYKGQKYMVEFVSANPTGPMHMGNARGGVLGDCLAEVLKLSGADVTREFYINDAGNQVKKLEDSLYARYMQQIKGLDAYAFPEDGYQGEDILELAKLYIKNFGNNDLDEASVRSKIVPFALEHNINKIKTDLARYKIEYDVWFHESTLHEKGLVKKAVDTLIANNVAYQDEVGTIFIKSTELFGSEKDDVLMRSNGIYTYFAADIAYHYDKFVTRGFDKCINIWGADHHGHVLRLQKALDKVGACGSEKLEVVLMQLVKLMRDGEVVRMSKRTGKAISLTDLLDEIPIDAARFFFNLRAADTHLEFDLDLAIKKDQENPVYYVQYAHARIESILKNLTAEGIDLTNLEDANLSLLSEKEELALIRLMSYFPEEIKNAAKDRDPSKINKYVISLAGAFHKFYSAVRIRGSESELLKARVVLCKNVQTTIKNALSVIGVSAPKEM